MILYVANDIMFIIGLRQYNRMKKGVEQDTKGWQCRTNTGKEDRACEKIRERSFIMLSGKYQKEQIELEQQITNLWRMVKCDHKKSDKLNLRRYRMNEWDKAQAGYLYNANHDKEIAENRIKCADLCYEFNQCKPSNTEKQAEIIKKMFGCVKGDFVITAPFYCDYGSNITIGKNFYTNHNCTILDGANVTFGDNVFVAPNVVFSTAGHAIDSEQRAKGLEIALPITVGDNVWIGANVSVLPGVSIGNNTIIGAGSVVNKDIPDGVIAAGVPCKVIRRITEDDRKKYTEYKEKQ